MKKIYKYKAEAYLKQDSICKFKIIREITIPNDNKYYVLEDVIGNKHLLPTEFYRNYDIKIKSEIECTVDKVNCIGRIFLEPLHHY